MFKPGRRNLFVLAVSGLATLLMSPAAVPAFDLHFDYTSFETGFGQAQFDVLNYPSINGNYMMTSTDNHRPEMVANGNNLAQFYNNFLADYNTQHRNNAIDAIAEADAIHQYTLRNSTKNGPRPTWLILNELSASLWPPNAGPPGNSVYRSWVIDCVTRLHEHYGYDVVTYSPFQNPGANDASWEALAEVSYIGIECYLSGTEVWNSGSDYASRLNWAQAQYQASKNSYLNRGVPANKLFVSEHFANNNATFTDNQGNVLNTGWGRAGLAPAAAWDSVIQIRQDAMLNVGFAGFLAYNWGGNAMGVTQAEQIQHEYYYRSRRVLPTQKPQWLSNSAINVGGATIPLSWSQPLNWLGGVPNASGAEANFWRTLTANRTITLDGNKTIGKLSFDSPFSYTVSPGTGGSLLFNNSGAATLTSNQGAHTIGVNVQLISDLSAAVNAATVTINGSISGAGGLTKSGVGALLLNGSNTYAGATRISAGALRAGATLNTPGAAITIDANGAFEATGAVQRAIVNNGVVKGPTAAGQQLRLTGQASGAGDYAGNVAFAGGFRPGDLAASIALANAIFEPTSTIELQIGGLAEGTQFDHLEVSGQLTLGGELAVSLIGGFTPQAGDSFNLFDWTSVSGSFGSIALPALSGLAWDDSQLHSTGILSVVYAVDFNRDGNVDGVDLATWSNGFGASGSATHAQGDSDGDRDVDGADFLVWQRQLGRTSEVGAIDAVPEPTPPTLGLLAAAGLALIQRGRRRLRRYGGDNREPASNGMILATPVAAS